MNVQMPFSGPLFPELGSRPLHSKLSGSAHDILQHFVLRAGEIFLILFDINDVLTGQEKIKQPTYITNCTFFWLPRTKLVHGGAHVL